MAERKETELPKTTISLKEQIARTILRNLKSRGITYIELRHDRKRCVFFCILCGAPCYSEPILHQHLDGKLHKEILACARFTLLKTNPWPFSDGVLFFDTSADDEDGEGVTGSLQPPSLPVTTIVVKYDKDRTSGLHGENQPAANTDDEPSHCSDNLLISHLLIKERTFDLQARFIGFGRIAARLFEKNGRLTWIDKLWCEWLGDKGLSDEEKATVPEHDFAIVTFTNFYNLGRLWFLNDPNCLLASSQSAQSGNGEDSSRKRKEYDSCEEISSARNSKSLRALAADFDVNLMTKRAIKKNRVRGELKKQHQLFSQRECEVCKRKMLPGKDAATILNLKTGKLACSSRNLLGSFHLFHMSCAVYWFLFFESEILGRKMVRAKGKKRGTAQSNGKGTDLLNDFNCQIFSVFCPECQGTGINIEGGVIERDTFPRSLTWRFGVKVGEGRKAWVKNPEKLKNCSIGFHFPQQAEESVQEERVQSLKLVRFYRVEL